jgi:REP element-mobilizing transposase RayT
MIYDPQIHNRQSIRLTGYDYSSPGHYFVTICVKDMVCIFGDVKNGIMGLSKNGLIIQDEWLKTIERRANIHLDEFVVMPNHVHGIIEIVNAGVDNHVGIDCNQSLHDETLRHNQPPHNYGPQSNNLFAIIRGFKGATTKRINEINGNYEHGSIWQSRFYDRIIDTDEQLEIIRWYIKNNPKRWNRDRNKNK